MPCPGCGERAALDDLGPLPDTRRFSAVDLAHTFHGGALLECRRCGLVFRSPAPAGHALEALYRDTEIHTWDEDPRPRPDWTVIRAVLDARVPRDARVLDVGCFSGGLAASLPGRVVAGVELNRAARSRAAGRGVQILGETLADVPPGPAFDAIVNTDVIEHVPRPLDLVRDAGARLRPGGVLIVATGDSAAPTFRFRRSRYWYCAIAEHVCFVNERWLRWAARRAGLDLVEVRRYRHEPFRLDRWLRQGALNVVDSVAPGAIDRVRRAFGRDTGNVIGWGQARDHLLAVLRRPGHPS